MPQAVAHLRARSVSGPNGLAIAARWSATDMRLIAYSRCSIVVILAIV
jgi:hypothetical protein